MQLMKNFEANDVVAFVAWYLFVSDPASQEYEGDLPGIGTVLSVSFFASSRGTWLIASVFVQCQQFRKAKFEGLLGVHI